MLRPGFHSAHRQSPFHSSVSFDPALDSGIFHLFNGFICAIRSNLLLQSHQYRSSRRCRCTDRSLCLSCARLQFHLQSFPGFLCLLFHLSHFRFPTSSITLFSSLLSRLMLTATSGHHCLAMHVEKPLGNLSSDGRSELSSSIRVPRPR